MMAQAAIGLGLHIRLLAEAPDVSAVDVVVDTEVGDYTDEATVVAFARACDVVTFDHEHVPQPILRRLLAEGTVVRPGPDALLYAQDKAAMRERLSKLGAPVPAFEIVRTGAELVAAGDRLGWPVIAKVSRGGYDGHGVWRVERDGDVTAPFAGLRDDAVVVVEECVDFVRELSALVVRSVDGTAVSYPVSESVQLDGMCRATVTPAPGLDVEVAAGCVALATRIAAELDVVGVLAVELMERRSGDVVVNELAMRPHNTGHWTIGGARTSQFENHLRAVAGLPLGDTTPTAPWVAMGNVLGDPDELDVPAWLARALDDPRVAVQWYGKSWRAGRKLGHVTVPGDSLAESVHGVLRAMPPGVTRDALEQVLRER